MKASLISYLAGLPALKIVRALSASRRPRHLRELAQEYRLSPSGVSDIVRRLKNARVIEEVREGNRRCFRLAVPEDEIECLNAFFSFHEKRLVRERAARHGKNAQNKLEWMDQAYLFYRRIKRK